MPNDAIEECLRLINRYAILILDDRKIIDSMREALDCIDSDNKQLMESIKEVKLLLQGKDA